MAYITPYHTLVINALGGGNTARHTDTHTLMYEPKHFKKPGMRGRILCMPGLKTHKTHTNTHINTYFLRHTYTYCTYTDTHFENLPHYVYVCNILIVDCQVNDRIKIVHVYGPVGLSTKYLIQVQTKIISNVHWLAELLTMQKLQE